MQKVKSPEVRVRFFFSESWLFFFWGGGGKHFVCLFKIIHFSRSGCVGWVAGASEYRKNRALLPVKMLITPYGFKMLTTSVVCILKG